MLIFVKGRARHGRKFSDGSPFTGAGFQWTRQDHSDWDTSHAAPVQYLRKHGHCRISTLDKDHAKLGNWGRTQRGKRRKGKLPPEQIRKLDAIGVAWEVPVGYGSRRR